jgi:hypothetical protein
LISVAGYSMIRVSDITLGYAGIETNCWIPLHSRCTGQATRE